MKVYYAVKTIQGDYRTDCLSNSFDETRESAIEIATKLVTDNWDDYFYGTDYENTPPENYFKTHGSENALDILDWTVVVISEKEYHYLSRDVHEKYPQLDTPYVHLPNKLELELKSKPPTKAELLHKKAEIEKQLRQLELEDLSQIAKDFFECLGIETTDEFELNANTFIKTIRAKNKQGINSYNVSIREISDTTIEIVHDERKHQHNTLTYLTLYLRDKGVDLMVENKYIPRNEWGMEVETPYGTLSVSYDILIEPENNSFHGYPPTITSSYLIEDTLPLKTPEDFDKLCDLIKFAQNEQHKEDQKQFEEVLKHGI